MKKKFYELHRKYDIKQSCLFLVDEDGDTYNKEIGNLIDFVQELEIFICENEINNIGKINV